MFLLHTLFSYIVSINLYGLTPAWNKCMYSLPVPALVLPAWLLPHCFIYAVVIFNVSSTRSIFKRPKEVEVRRCQIWAVGWMGQHRPTHFGDVFPGSQACVRACTVMLEQHF
jgi:hypothetical protein